MNEKNRGKRSDHLRQRMKEREGEEREREREEKNLPRPANGFLGEIGCLRGSLLAVGMGGHERRYPLVKQER